jgi:hypothetical protein
VITYRTPAEIRNIIYAYALGGYVIRVETKTGTRMTQVRVHGRTATGKTANKPTTKCNALSSTCCQVGFETGLMSFALDHFKLNGP